MRNLLLYAIINNIEAFHFSLALHQLLLFLMFNENTILKDLLKSL